MLKVVVVGDSVERNKNDKMLSWSWVDTGPGKHNPNFKKMLLSSWSDGRLGAKGEMHLVVTATK